MCYGQIRTIILILGHKFYFRVNLFCISFFLDNWKLEGELNTLKGILYFAKNFRKYI